MLFLRVLSLTIVVISATSLSAQDMAITSDLSRIEFSVNGQDHVISRSGDSACPPACIQPQQAAPGVATIGEVELITFIQAALGQGTGLLIDTRLPSDYATGSIPGAVNIPSATMTAENPYRVEILKALGATQSGTELDFAGSKSLAIFDTGATSAIAATTLQALVETGYPANKLLYYRAGTSGWTAMGLSTTGQEN